MKILKIILNFFKKVAEEELRISKKENKND